MEVKETSRSITINSFIPVTVISGFGVAFAVVLMAFNCKYRNMRLVKMSSPNINVMMLVGAIFLYVSCALYGLEATQNVSRSLATYACRIWPWIVSIAYTFLFGSLFAKSWRVHRIFRSAGIKRTVIKDEKLVVIVIGLVMIDVVILGLWQGLDPLTSIRVSVFQHKQMSAQISTVPTTTAHRSSSATPTTTGSDLMEVIITRTTCTCHYPSVWFALLLLWKGLLLFYGTYLSWVIRHVTLPSMNDSTCIVISCHVTTIVSAAAISLAVIFQEYPDVVYASASLAVWLSTTITISVEFLPKVRLWMKKSVEQESLKVSISSQVYSSPGQTYEQMEEEMYHLVAENRALKKSLTVKDVTIKNLQDHVTSAKEKLTHLLDANNVTKEDSGVSGSFELPTPIPRDQPDNDSGHAGDESNESIETHTFSRGVTCRESHMIKESTPHSPRSSYRIKRRASMRSLTSYASDVQKLAELTDAIAEDLDHANCISTNLRTSICLDLSAASFETRSATYKYVRSKQDLSGAIAETYDLDDNCDTYSYVSSHLPRRPASVASSVGTSVSLSRHSRCSSCDSISTLGNDKMYPGDTPAAPGATPRTRRGTTGRRQRRTRRVSRRRSWKRRPTEKVYSIQEPREPYVNQVGVAFRRDLSDTMV